MLPRTYRDFTVVTIRCDLTRRALCESEVPRFIHCGELGRSWKTNKRPNTNPIWRSNGPRTIAEGGHQKSHFTFMKGVPPAKRRPTGYILVLRIAPDSGTPAPKVFPNSPDCTAIWTAGSFALCDTSSCSFPWLADLGIMRNDCT